MNWFLIISNTCNLRCIYCMNEPHPKLPVTPNWNIEELKSFLATDKNPDIAFYGGEALLEIELIEKIIREINADHFTLQTNGILLHKLQTEYLRKFSTILISIDGNRQITDYYRGKGVYDKIQQNVSNILERGFAGDLVARMAISEKSNIYEDVVFLLNEKKLSFNHVHWQLDCQWDYEMTDRWEDFPAWIKKYNEGISKLVAFWLEYMKKGEIKGIVPFIGIFKHIINNTSTELPCKAGLRSFAIRTDGIVTFCPLPPEFEKTVVGDIRKDTSENLRDSIKISDPCPKCGVFNLCGGRCLFANLYKLWGEEGFNLVCSTVKHLISELKGIKTQVEKLIREGIINKADFDYPRYNNTTEIIP